ncbi:MAG: CAP domain-containing protein [Burkholderiaceae bacterium]
MRPPSMPQPSLSLSIISLLLCAAAAAPVAAQAPAPELVDLVNRYRAEAPACAGRIAAPLRPLQSDSDLARVRIDRADALPAALERAGYLAARAQAVVVSGPRDAPGAMTVLRERYCSVLLDPDFRRIAATRAERDTWRLLLARPLLAADLPLSPEAGREVLAQVNAARGRARSCGERRFAAAPALRWNPALAQTALGHSEDMARNDHFEHRGRDGSDAAQRATRNGYRWRRIGENIAAGQGDPAQVVAGWIASPGHCVNLMERAYTEMGAGYAIDPASQGKIYWTQVFGTPR